MGIQSATNAALSGVIAATAVIESIAHNLANAHTDGYQAQKVDLATRLHGGVQVLGVSRDTSPGALRTDQPRTDRPLPLLALEGEGLFILERSGERVYSRDGNLSLDAEGHLVNSIGDRLLGYATNAAGVLDRTQLSHLQIRLGSTIESPNATTAKLIGYTVQRSGRLVGKYSDGVNRTLGQLRIARFPNPQVPAAATSSLYRQYGSTVPLETDPDTDGAASIVPAVSELSNVDAGEQLIQLSLARSHFRLNIATLDTADSLLQELMQLGQRRL